MTYKVIKLAARMALATGDDNKETRDLHSLLCEVASTIRDLVDLARAQDRVMTAYRLGSKVGIDKSLDTIAKHKHLIESERA